MVHLYTHYDVIIDGQDNLSEADLDLALDRIDMLIEFYIQELQGHLENRAKGEYKGVKVEIVENPRLIHPNEKEA